MTRSAVNPVRLRNLLSRFAGRRLLVVGDIILDEYLSGDARRISPEAPIPVIELRDEAVTLGAAAYVASHVANLGGQASLCGVVGDDANGTRLRELLEQRGIGAEGVMSDPSRPTIVKTRVIARRQQMLRIDREHPHALSRSLHNELLRALEREAACCEAMLLVDYDKGTFSPELISGAIRAARKAGIPVAVNPKPRLALRFRGADIISMNAAEASACLHRALPDESSLLRAGPELLRKAGSGAMLVTRGEHGMALFTRGKRPLRIPTRAREVFDVTGAGDTVIAVTAMGLAAGGRLPDCVQLANVAAGLEVGKLGCALISAAEIRKEL